MPALENARYEEFAQLVASGATPAKAYTSLGYSPNGAGQSAHRLLKHADVSRRVAEIKAGIADAVSRAVAVDRVWVLDRLKQNVDHCTASNQLMAANRALELIGKELGMFRDHVEHEHTGEGGGPIDIQVTFVKPA